MSEITTTITRAEDIPTGAPRRYANDRGYIRLRWRVGTAKYAECYEHRMVAGFPPRHMHVHHIDGDKTNNEPANLLVLTRSEHQTLHSEDPEWMVRVRSSRPKRQPLDEYPRCEKADCGRPAQCLSRTVCLKHYKAVQRQARKKK